MWCRALVLGNTFEMAVFLETDRMTLSWFRETDADLLFDLDNDPLVMRYINGGLPVEQTEVASQLSYWLTTYPADGRFGFWRADEKTTGQFVGWFHLRPRLGEDPSRPELGYRMCRAAWGKGLATEGSRALIDMGFRQLPVNQVYATTMAVNLASRRVMEKAGLRIERSFIADWPIRIVGDDVGGVEYAVTRPQWEQDQKVDESN